jgi:hypothetical protein
VRNLVRSTMFWMGSFRASSEEARFFRGRESGCHRFGIWHGNGWDFVRWHFVAHRKSSVLLAMRRTVEIEKCARCGEPKEEHCEYKPEQLSVPETCSCYREDWGSYKIPNVCGTFVQQTGKYASADRCETCEHDKACHVCQHEEHEICDCDCHGNPDIRHIMPCCHPCPVCGTNIR